MSASVWGQKTMLETLTGGNLPHWKTGTARSNFFDALVATLRPR
jgi:hypothetical protein